ncbi:KR-domain-containing protein [Aspergillus ellipticus CBS 707.79]|uniref:KR-domain-containing protein n=1 Tax=Aspergillus ellipticus CBS 707.79 TaxID=1448320 RepID=A0A319CQL4_9EURO|nr:KR-domain-containing protein [Aspergillus ellipticus CBS 707.79]
MSSLSRQPQIRPCTSYQRQAVAGVMNLAMVLYSMAFPRMSHEDWKVALVSKVQGTWNLHTAFATTDLDFFLLFSSIRSVLGSLGQANYSAESSFVGSFTRYRRSLGLPASVLNIGATDEIGYMAEHPDVYDKVASTGRTEQGQKGHAHCATRADVSLPATNGHTAPTQLSIGISSKEKGVHRPNTRDIRLNGLLNSFVSLARIDPSILETPESTKLLIDEISKMVCSMLSMPEDDLVITRSLSLLGRDSLVNIQIRKWFTVHLGIEIAVLEISALGSVQTLTDMAIGLLKEKYAKKVAE